MRFFLIPILLVFTLNAHAEVMRIIILGSGTPRPNIERFSQSILIEVNDEKLLFDSGRGATIRLNQANIPLKEIKKVFLTHLHSDHTIGLSDIIMTGWIYQRDGVLNIYGPKGTIGLVDNLKKAYSEDISIRTVPPENHSLEGLKTKVIEIEEGLIYQKEKLKVYAIRVDHGGGVKNAFGYKIVNDDQSIIISGDTNYSSNLIKHAKYCDVLIHEIASAPEKLIKKNAKIQGLMNYHTTPDEMARVIESIKPRLTILTHVLALGGVSEKSIVKKIKNLNKKSYKIIMAYDLMAIDVKKDIQIYSLDYSNDPKN